MAGVRGGLAVWYDRLAGSIFSGFPMAVFTASRWPLLLLLFILTSCAGNTGVQDALKSDPRLTSSTATPAPNPEPSPSQSSSPSPSISSSIAPTNAPTSSLTSSPSANADINNTGTPSWPDLDQTPANLRPYLNDLLALDLVKPELKSESKSDRKTDQKSDRTPTPSRLSDPIDRRTFAKWLLQVNNRFYDSTKQIRTATPTTKPVFQDINANDPDFPTIQGLAEAGIIPRALTNSAGSDRFYPDKPITREDVLRWKVPLDARTTLPPATVGDIRKAWAFQDLDKINPVALSALYTDHQNGDASNLRRAFGYTTLLQPKRSITHAEAAAILWSIGFQSDRITAQDLRKNRP